MKAKDCPGKIKRGNDGLFWKSLNKGKSFRWYPTGKYPVSRHTKEDLLKYPVLRLGATANKLCYTLKKPECIVNDICKWKVNKGCNRAPKKRYIVKNNLIKWDKEIIDCYSQTCASSHDYRDRNIKLKAAGNIWDYRLQDYKTVGKTEFKLEPIGKSLMTTREKAVNAEHETIIKNARTFKTKIRHEREKYLVQLMKIPKPITQPKLSKVTQNFKLKIQREEDKYQLILLKQASDTIPKEKTPTLDCFSNTCTIFHKKFAKESVPKWIRVSPSVEDNRPYVEFSINSIEKDVTLGITKPELLKKYLR
jgi:hypothetical protein